MITSRDVVRAEKNGISLPSLRRRLSRGWDMERATTEPIIKQRGLWLKIAKENGINQSAFDSRINRLGWTYEKAATKEVRRRTSP